MRHLIGNLGFIVAGILAIQVVVPSTYAGAPPQVNPRPPAPTGSGPVQDTNGRIQLDSWTNAALDVKNDPLTEIVEVKDEKTGRTVGTGTFLRDCRVLTTLRVLLSIEHGKPTPRLERDESLIGKAYAFDTKPVAPNGTRKRSHMVVIAHGDLEGADEFKDALRDWALGYDEGCLSEKLNLGFVSFASTSPGFMSLLRNELTFTAGYSQLAAAKRDGRQQLYIDSDCEPQQKISGADHLYTTNCSVGEGGAGQLLLGPRTTKGTPTIGPNGRIQKWAYGMFLAPTSGAATAPNVSQVMSLLVFGSGGADSVDLQRRHYLLGAVDLARLRSRPISFCSNLVAIGREAQGEFVASASSVGPGRAGSPAARLSLGGVPAPTACGVTGSSIDRYSSRFTCSWLDRTEAEVRSAFETTASAVQACFPAYLTEAKREPQNNTLDVTIPDGVPGGNSWIRIRADRNGMLMSVWRPTRAEVMLARPPRTFVSKDFCDRLSSVSHPSGVSTGDQSLPGATNCSSTLNPARYSCTWSNRPAQEAKREFEVLASSAQACFPTGQAFEVHEQGRLNFDLFVPAEAPATGVSRFGLRLERGEISLVVSRRPQ